MTTQIIKMRGNLRVSYQRREEVKKAGQRSRVVLMKRQENIERHEFKVLDNEEEFGVRFL